MDAVLSIMLASSSPARSSAGVSPFIWRRSRFTGPAWWSSSLAARLPGLTPVKPIQHVVGKDPIPEDLLREVTDYLAKAAACDPTRIEDSIRAAAPEPEGEVQTAPRPSEGVNEVSSGAWHRGLAGPRCVSPRSS